MLYVGKNINEGLEAFKGVSLKLLDSFHHCAHTIEFAY